MTACAAWVVCSACLRSG